MTTTRRREAGELPPEHGARFVLERLDGEVGRARYEVRIEAPARGSEANHAVRGVATIRSASDVVLGAWDGAPEPWAVDTALGVCRTLGKNHAEHGDWPGVLRRWRAPRT